MKSTLTNMIIVLLTVTFIASVAVGVVYQLTLDPIKDANETKLNLAISKVMPEFTKLGDIQEVEKDGEKIKIYPALNGDQIVGYAVETYSKKGFGGKIDILVGFLPDGTVNNTAVMQHKETPGLGDNMDQSKSDFSLQFNGKKLSDMKLLVKKDGGDVDAISAATISSRAFTDAMVNANEFFNQIKK